MSLEITPKTRYAIYLAITFNGKPTDDCVAINLETNDGTFLNRSVIGGRAPGNEPQYITLRGEFKLSLMPRVASLQLTPEEIINEMRQSVLWEAMTEEERKERFRQPLSADPLPRDAEAKEIFDRLFADYRASLTDEIVPATVCV